MKYIIGIIITLIILLTTTYALGNLWGYTLITTEQLKKGLISIIIIGLCSILLLIFVPFFFKNHSKGYIKEDTNVAQPKKSKF